MALERLVTILAGLGRPVEPGAPLGRPGTVPLGLGKVGITVDGKGTPEVGKAVEFVTALSTAEIDERSTELVSMGRGGNEAVGSPEVGIPLPGRVGVGSPALGTETPESDGRAVRMVKVGAETPGSEGNAVAVTLGTDAPGTDVRRIGVGITPPVGSESVARLVGSVGGFPTLETGGRTGGKGKAGEAAAWKTYAPSDIRMSWSIVENASADIFGQI